MNSPRLWGATALLLAACSPGAVHFPEDLTSEEPLQGWPEDPALVAVSRAESGVVVCEDPEARDHMGPFVRRLSGSPRSSRSYLWSGGLMAGDLDQDGFPDMVAPAEPFAKLYLGRTEGRTEEVSTLFAFDLAYGSGGSVADYDGDGDLDVLVLRWERPDVLLRNEGGGQFVDVSEAAGLHVPGASTCSAWADIDLDGDLDLFIGQHGDERGPTPSYLFENRGDGTFADRSEHLPIEVHDAYTRMAGWHDLDLDGYPELYLVNDVGELDPNLLLWNVGGRLTVDDGTHGLNLGGSGSGLGVGDINGDNLPDLLVTQWGRLALLQSTSDGGWTDHAQERGVIPDPARGQVVGFGAELVDLNNDGAQDAVVAFGNMEVDVPGWDNPLAQEDALFIQQGDGSFVDEAERWGVNDAGTGRGFVVTDLNADGFLDLVKRDLRGPNVMYMSRCGAEAWLEVELHRPGQLNTFAVGARVTLEAGERTWTRTVRAGGTGAGTAGPPSVHFGLGDVEEIDRLVVVWPNGDRSELFHLTPRQMVSLTAL